MGLTALDFTGWCEAVALMWWRWSHSGRQAICERKKKMKRRQGGKPAIREIGESENVICGLKIVNKQCCFTSFTV